MNKKEIIRKNLHFTGVDYDNNYIELGKKTVKNYELEKYVRLFCRSIYEKNLEEELGNKFDSAYFSGSFSLMPDPVNALHVTASMLKPNGLIYITQTFQKKSTPFLATIKPLLKYLTTIDFGNLIYEE